MIPSIVATEQHPVNRLVEAYGSGHLSWTLIGAKRFFIGPKT